MTRRTLPLAPRFLPEITRTSSFFLILVFLIVVSPSLSIQGICPRSARSDDLRSERDDLHELALAQLARDRAEDARADRLFLVVDQHRRVRVEADVAAVAPLLGVHRADDDRLDDCALLHRAVGSRFLDRSGDHVA